MMMWFNLTERGQTIVDEDGADVIGIEDARRVAITAAREIMGAQLHAGYLDTGARIDVVDATGDVLLSVRFTHAFIDQTPTA